MQIPQYDLKHGVLGYNGITGLYAVPRGLSLEAIATAEAPYAAGQSRLIDLPQMPRMLSIEYSKQDDTLLIGTVVDSGKNPMTIGLPLEYLALGLHQQGKKILQVLAYGADGTDTGGLYQRLTGHLGSLTGGASTPIPITTETQLRSQIEKMESVFTRMYVIRHADEMTFPFRQELSDGRVIIVNRERGGFSIEYIHPG